MSRFLAVLLVATLAACDSVPEPDPVPPVGLDVVTRNLSRGADLTAAFGRPGSVETRAFQLYGDIISSNFPDRAGALAQEIELLRPHAVGLQEVLTARTQFPSDADGSVATPNASRVTVDHLATLLDSMRARGLNYRVAAEAELWDHEFPAGRTGGATFDVRLTERVVVLVADTLVSTPASSARWDGSPISDLGISEPTGYAAATLAVGQQSITVAAARFDADSDRTTGDALDLAAALGDGPTVVMGTVAEAGSEATLAAVRRAGFADAWMESGSGAGETCCVGPDLTVFEAVLTSRADGIWVSGGRARTIDLYSETRASRTVAGWWPSNRAGVFAHLILGTEPA